MGIGRTLRSLNGMVDADVIGSYAVAGAFAAFRHLQPSHVDRVEVLVPAVANDVPAAVASWLADGGWHDARDGAVVVGDWPVLFTPAVGGLAGEALAAAVPVDVDMGDGTAPFTIRALTAEHLAATTLATGRHDDRERLVQLLEEGVPHMAALDDILRRHGLVAAWRDFVARYGPVIGPMHPKSPHAGYPDISDVLARKAQGRLDLGALLYGSKLARMRGVLAGMAAARDTRRTGRPAGNGARDTGYEGTASTL